MVSGPRKRTSNLTIEAVVRQGVGVLGGAKSRTGLCSIVRPRNDAPYVAILKITYNARL